MELDQEVMHVHLHHELDLKVVESTLVDQDLLHQERDLQVLQDLDLFQEDHLLQDQGHSLEVRLLDQEEVVSQEEAVEAEGALAAVAQEEEEDKNCRNWQ